MSGDLEQSGPQGLVIDGKYQVLEQIDKGSMSTVYIGYHLMLGRQIAIKFLSKKRATDATDLARFQQEAKLLSKLSHPTIVSIYDFGESQSYYYLIMDYIQGVNLGDAIDARGALSVAECLPILIQLCDGLEHAHRKGILHRDLKPNNVMLVTGEDPWTQVRLVDFGIAKSINNQSSMDSLQLTQAGETVGSPSYMSPEQIRADQLDQRTDIYSLGCLTYHALTGSLPFPGRNILDIYMKHTTEMPRSFKEARPQANINPLVERVVFKMLAKQRENRHPSMLALKLELASILEQLAKDKASC